MIPSLPVSRHTRDSVVALSGMYHFEDATIRIHDLAVRPIAKYLAQLRTMGRRSRRNPARRRLLLLQVFVLHDVFYNSMFFS